MAKYFSGDLGDVTDPSDAASGAAAFAQRAVAPLGMNIAGEEAGAALAAALGPETGGLSIALPIILGMLGAGTANVAAKHLPESLGGMPEQSNKAAFALGALPAGVGRAAGAGFAARAAKQTAQAGKESAETFAKGIEEQSGQTFKQLQEAVKPEPQGTGQVRRAGQLMGAPGGLAQKLTSPALRGEARTQATFKLRDAIMGPIDRLRDKIAAPLEAAYGKLTASSAPADVEGLRDAVQGIKGELFGGVDANTQRLLGNVSAMNPVKELPKDPIILPDGSVYVPGEGGQPSEGEEILGGRKKEATIGDLARKRQEVNLALRKATGSNRYALKRLRYALDAKLTPAIGEDLSGPRGSYLGFIKNYDWKDINKLANAGSPAEVSKWFFSRPADQVAEVIEGATDQEKAAYQAMFAQHTLGGIDPRMPVSEQQTLLRKQVGPFINSGVAHELYGPRVESALRAIVDAPVNRADLATALNHPSIKKLWDQGFQSEARVAGKSARDAVDAAYQEIVKALPPEQAATLQGIARPVPGQQLPVLLNPPEAMTEQFRARGSEPGGMVGYAKRRAGFSIPMGLASVAAGRTMGAGWALSVGAAAGAVVGSEAAWRTFLNHGGAELMAKLYATPAGRKAGAAAFRAFAQLGGRLINQKANSPDGDQ